MSSTTSDFEEIGFSDCESIVTGSDNDNCSSKRKSVIVQLPPDLLVRSHAAPTSSSCVPVQRLGNLTTQTVGDNPKMRSSSTTSSIDSSWTFAERTTGNASLAATSVAGSAASSVAGSSVISSFDILSIGGSSNRRCRWCTFLNKEVTDVCGACSEALVANPRLDVDHQIARHLQQMEEEDALHLQQMEEEDALHLQQMEEEDALQMLQEAVQRIKVPESVVKAQAKLRKWVTGEDVDDDDEDYDDDDTSSGKPDAIDEEEKIFQQAQTLATDVVNNSLDLDTHGIATFSVADLTVHIVQIIKSISGVDEKNVRLHYHFSSDLSTELYAQIRVGGFRGPCTVSQNVQAAYYKDRPMPKLYANWGSSVLQSIPEDNSLYQSPKLGWIVATVGQGVETCVAVSSGTAMLETFKTFGADNFIIPLVAFDESLRSEDIVRRLMNAMSRTCHDFFWFLDSSSDHDTSERIVSKRKFGGDKNNIIQTLEEESCDFQILLRKPEPGKVKRKRIRQSSLPAIPASDLKPVPILMPSEFGDNSVDRSHSDKRLAFPPANQSKQRPRGPWIVHDNAFWYDTCAAFVKRKELQPTYSQQAFISEHPELRKHQAWTLSRKLQKYRDGKLQRHKKKTQAQREIEAKMQMIKQLAKPENQGISWDTSYPILLERNSE